MEELLQGRGALVTGGGNGLGRAIALRLASAGASVIVAGRRIEPLEATASLASDAGQIMPVAADVTRGDDRARLVEEAARRWGRLDILVNAAGILEGGSIDTTTIEDWDRTMDVNVRSLFELTRLSIPHLVAARGTILNLSSVAG